jgi:PTS system nitrogen regulatory IIA component
MNITDIIVPERVACDIDASSKKRALEKISDIIASDDTSHLAAQDVVDSLIAREKLGSTGIGSGVAIPHGRLKNSDKTIAAFLQLHHGIDYDAIDDQDVDLMFALLVPEHSTDEHLQILAELAEMFSHEEIREKLRQTKDNQQICDLLTHWKKYVEY